MSLRHVVIGFLQSKGVDTDELTDDSLLLQSIRSVDFMELIVTAEMQIDKELDLESIQIEEISSLGGFVSWLEKS